MSFHHSDVPMCLQRKLQIGCLPRHLFVWAQRRVHKLACNHMICLRAPGLWNMICLQTNWKVNKITPNFKSDLNQDKFELYSFFKLYISDFDYTPFESCSLSRAEGFWLPLTKPSKKCAQKLSLLFCIFHTLSIAYRGGCYLYFFNWNET